jgi:transcriptional regulator with XRE-family HTH domain
MLWPISGDRIVDSEIEEWLLDASRWLIDGLGGRDWLSGRPLVLPTEEFFARSDDRGRARARRLFESVKREARAAELLAEHATLDDLRRAFKKTQADLAGKLGVGQDAISRLEKRSDMLLSTLRSYVAALGGELSLVATFPDRPPVKIETLDWIAPERDEAQDQAPSQHVAKKASRRAVKAR